MLQNKKKLISSSFLENIFKKEVDLRIEKWPKQIQILIV